MRTIPRLRHTVDECNPFGMDQRRSARCVLDKPIVFPELDPTLEEYGDPSGFYMEGSTSVITTGYKAKTYPSTSYLLYNWTVTGATIVAGGSGYDYVEVETRSNNAEDTFTIDLVVRNAEQEDSVSQNFTHTRVEKLYDIVLLDIVEDTAGSCTWDTTLLCKASSTYSATYTHEHGTVNYTWACQGAGIVDNGDGTATVSTDSDEDDTFVVSLVLTDDHSSDSRSEEFTHSRTENPIEPVVITDITEDAAGSCEWFSGGTCDAVSTHTVVHTSGTMFEWFSPSATILSGQNTETVTVETTNHADIAFDLQCIVRNSISSKKRIETFTHTREEGTDPVDIVSLTELIAGDCNWLSPATCVAQSTYEVVATDSASYEWVVVGATIVSGQGTTQVVVSTDSNADTSFTVTSNVTGVFGGVVSEDILGTHTRTEIFDPVEVVSITETISGACDWFSPGTCVATSTYDVVATDYDTLVWTVTGATLASGQGTTQITVTSDDNADTNFSVSCTANGLLGGNDVEVGNYTHLRTELFEEFDQTLLYDATNIATEFI